MRIKEVFQATKTDVTWDGWHTGAMPKTTFPLGKSGKHSLNFRGGYEWCCLRFRAMDREFRLLVAVNFQKVDYCAHLGVACGADTQMLSSYEFHSTHPGWHVHSGCRDIQDIPIGRYKGPWKGRYCSKRKEWGLNDKHDALGAALRFFKVPPPPILEEDRQLPLV